jgi:hypothetical protein
MTSKFTYSKTIKLLNTKFDMRDSAQMRVQMNKFRGYMLDKPVHLYRMWFLLVKLVLDCEHNKIKFGVNGEHKVKLNKKFYKDWEMEKYLDSNFDNWMKDKIHLFAEEKASLVKEGEKSDEHLYIKFHRRQRKEDLIRQVRTLLKDGKFETQSKFPITKQHKYFYLHQQYNAFILRQNGAGHDDVVKFMNIYTLYSDRVSTSYSSLRRLYRASEQLVLDVAKGEF